MKHGILKTAVCIGLVCGMAFALQVRAQALHPHEAIGQFAHNMVQNAVLEKAELTGGMSATGEPMMDVDAFINFYELDNNRGEGTTYGLNPSVTYGDKTQFTATLPIYFDDPDNSDDSYTIGIDGRVKHYLNQNLAIGGHANYLNRHEEGFLDFDDDVDLTTLGPFVSYNMLLSETMNLSFGGLLDYIYVHEDDVDDDDRWTAGVGANLGIMLTEQVALNPYAVYYTEIDAEHNNDDDYVDLGVEIAASMCETWSLTAGVKTTVDYDEYDKAYQVDLGSTWQF